MSELFVVIVLLFGVACGGVLVWMWMFLRELDQRAELETVYQKYAEWLARALAAETRVAWWKAYADRTYSELVDVRQELELEQIVSDAYAAGIAKDENR